MMTDFCNYIIDTAKDAPERKPINRSSSVFGDASANKSAQKRPSNSITGGILIAASEFLFICKPWCCYKRHSKRVPQGLPLFYNYLHNKKH